jgi:ankyrin repeat protein
LPVVHVTIGPYGTALHAACIEGNLNAAKHLLKQHGADISLSGGKFGSVLQAAAFKGKISLVRLLLKHNANVNQIGGTYKTALQAACAAGDVQIAKILLDHGADVNITGGRYGSALEAASVSGNVPLVRLLLCHKADPKARSGFYGTAFCAASVLSDHDVVNVLLKEAGVAVEMLGERKPHFKGDRWDRSPEFVESIKIEDGELEPFDRKSIHVLVETDDENEEGQVNATVNGEGNANGESAVLVSSAMSPAEQVAVKPEQGKVEEVV